jgi:transposase
MNPQNVTKWCREFSEGRTDVHDEQRSGRPSLISDRRQTSMTRRYRNWFEDLINVWTMLVIMLKNKVMYRQFMHSVAFVN